ncbi:MAG: SRPBCC domain-containing protein [Gemmatimonadaceae bacterium]
MAVQASQVRATVKAPPSAVWKALTTTGTLKQFFFGSDISTDWQVGSPITFSGTWKGKPYQDKGNVQTFERERRLAFTHWSPLSGMDDVPENYHVVSFDLRPVDGATEVALTQTNLNDAEPLTPENRQEYAKNWTMVLDGLKKIVEGAAFSERSGVSSEARQ